ncbi:unnamed protein product [Closterium sp. NIES-64]|nr:unnamed protein product [Closterium sp. NIES-64]
MASLFPPTQDECDLVYISGDREKTFPLANVSQILWGQRTGSFARSSRSDKDNQSFSLIFGEGERPLDVVWKDTEEAEMWYTGMRALVERNRRPKSERLGLSHRRSASMTLDELREWSPDMSPFRQRVESSPPVEPNESGSLADYRSPPESRGTGRGEGMGLDTLTGAEAGAAGGAGSSTGNTSAAANAGTSSSPASANFPYAAAPAPGHSTVIPSTWSADRAELLPGLPVKSFYSGSSDGSGYLPSATSSSTGDDGSEVLGDLFMWGEGLGDGALGGGGLRKRGASSAIPIPGFDSVVPKPLDAGVVLDVCHVACGEGHAALVTRRGEVFCWGEEGGGRLGQGRERDLEHPKLVEGLDGIPMDEVSELGKMREWGEMGVNGGGAGTGRLWQFHHTRSLQAGEEFLWGDGRKGRGLLGGGVSLGGRPQGQGPSGEGGYEDMPQWVPRRVGGALDGVYSGAGGMWAVARGGCSSYRPAVRVRRRHVWSPLGMETASIISSPKEVESLQDMWVSRVACGVWHTAAVVHAPATASTPFPLTSCCPPQTLHYSIISSPKEVESLRGMRVSRVACGVWHTAAVVHGPSTASSGTTAASDTATIPSAGTIEGDSAAAVGTVAAAGGRNRGNRWISWGRHGRGAWVAGGVAGGRLYTWGDGDRWHALTPSGHVYADITVALTPSGHVYAMGSAAHGQLGNPQADGHTPALLSRPPLFKKNEQIACGTHHTAALTAASDILLTPFSPLCPLPFQPLCLDPTI